MICPCVSFAKWEKLLGPIPVLSLTLHTLFFFSVCFLSSKELLQSQCDCGCSTVWLQQFCVAIKCEWVAVSAASAWPVVSAPAFPAEPWSELLEQNHVPTSISTRGFKGFSRYCTDHDFGHHDWCFCNQRCGVILFSSPRLSCGNHVEFLSILHLYLMKWLMKEHCLGHYKPPDSRATWPHQTIYCTHTGVQKQSCVGMEMYLFLLKLKPSHDTCLVPVIYLTTLTLLIILFYTCWCISVLQSHHWTNSKTWYMIQVVWVSFWRACEAYLTQLKQRLDLFSRVVPQWTGGHCLIRSVDCIFNQWK